MSREEVKQRLIDLIEPSVNNLGFELVQLEYVVGRYGTLRLIIDHENGISIDDCAMVSRAVSELLDVKDPITHAYALEVLSPGLERPLTKREHFMRFQGEKVKIKTKEEVEGSRNISGLLQVAAKEHIVIRKEDGKLTELPYELIARANLWHPKTENNKPSKNKRKEAQ